MFNVMVIYQNCVTRKLSLLATAVSATQFCKKKVHLTMKATNKLKHNARFRRRDVCSDNIALRNLSLLKWFRKLLMFSSYRCPFCSVFFCTLDYSSLTTDISSILNALALVFIDFHQSQLTLLVYTVNSQNLLTPVLVMMLKLLDFKMVIILSYSMTLTNWP